MSNCCASGRVCFLGGLSFACACVCSCVCTLARLLPGGEGWCVWVCGASVGLKSWKTATEQSTSRSPGRHWSLGSPSNERGWEIHAHCSSERVVGVPNAYITALLVWHGVWGFLFLMLCSFFFLKGLKGWSPPPNGNMKPFVLLSSPTSVTTVLPSPPSRPFFPAAFTHFVCLSSAFRQLQHSSVWTVTNSCTLDTPTRFAVSLPQCPRPVCSPISAWEFGVWNVFDSWGGVPRLIILSVE